VRDDEQSSNADDREATSTMRTGPSTTTGPSTSQAPPSTAPSTTTLPESGPVVLESTLSPYALRVPAENPQQRMPSTPA
jgi:hypothetical protein